MNVKNSWKRVVAGMLAVLVMAATVPAGTDFGGVFGGSGIVASAEEAATTITWTASDMPGDDFGTSFTKDGITLTAGNIIDFNNKNIMGGGTFTTDSGKITKIEVVAQNVNCKGTGWSGNSSKKTWEGDASSSVSFSDDIKDNGTGKLTITFTIKPEEAKTEWAIGENINLDGKWFFADDMGSARVHGRNSSAVVPKPSYEGTYGQWIFENSISVDQVSFDGDIFPDEHETHLCLKKPSDKTSADIPSGFKIKGGSGTQADPYTFELVYPSKVDVTGVTLKESTTLTVGDTETLTATVAPDGATDKTVTWASSNTSVATVSDTGVVTAVAAGTATITATATNGTADVTDDDKTATCTVTVNKPDATVKTAPTAKDLTYTGESQALVTEGTAEGGTMQYAVVETDGDTSEYTIVKRDSTVPLVLADVKVNTIYTPDLEGEYQGYAGIWFSNNIDLIIDDITYNGLSLFYNHGDSKYYLDTNKGSLPLPEGFDGLLITDIDNGNVYAEFVNTANLSGEVVIDEEAWVESIPNETDAGEYDVYYRVKGDDNHNDSKPTKIDGVKIAKADPTVTAPQPCDLTYSGKNQALITEGTATGGTIQYALGQDAQTAPTEGYSEAIPTETNAGKYYVWYKVVGGNNYNDVAPACVTAEIKKADATVTGVPQPCDLTYNGKNQALITEGTATGGTMQYALSASPETQPKGEYSETVPSGKNAGDYYVWYKVKGDENHNDTAPTCVTAKIKKADISPTAKNLTYNGQAQELVKAGQSPAIKVVYALGEDGQTAPTEGYSETIPTATNAGTHYVWYKILGDLNYNDMPPVCLPVTIKQAAATVTANNITKKWGDKDPVLTYTVTGLIGNESLTGELARAEGDAVGTYAITQGTLANPNYNITFTPGVFTIETAYFTINFVDEDGKVLQTSEVANGVIPEFTGATPTKESTVQEEFTFKGWSPELTEVTGAATYTAVYESKRIGAEVNRLAGADRYATAVEISKAGFEKAENVILTSGSNYADGIAGVPLAARLGAPILLTAADKLSDATLAEIERLGAKNVYILGGEGVISADIEKALQEKGLQTWRIAGDNRYATSAAIAQRVSEDPTDIFFVYGGGFADTLSVSAIAARRNAPIVYLDTNGELDPSIAQYLAVLKDKGCVKNAYVIGGTGVISDDMMNKATAALGLESATRIAGNDRYATSAAVNKAFVDNFDSDELCVATGADFADAVTGGVFAAAKKAPFILVSSKLNEDQIAFINSRSPMKINVFGGTGAVSDETVKAVIDAIVTAPNAAPQNITTQSE